MSIFTTAFEKRKKEKSIKSKRLPAGQPVKLIKTPSVSENVKMFIRKGDFDPSLVVLSSPDSLAAENFKNLRAHLLFPKADEKRRVIMVTSAFPGEGKTYVAANIAASIALGVHEHVLLVDCDLRRPSIHQVFRCANRAGLHEHLTENMKLKDLIIQTKLNKLSLLPAGREAHNPSELLSSKIVKDSLEELRDRYDDRFIIIDSPPSQVASEANVLANYVDGIILVVMAQGAHRILIHKSIGELGRENILGIIFNGYKRSYSKHNRYYDKRYKGHYGQYSKHYG